MDAGMVLQNGCSTAPTKSDQEILARGTSTSVDISEPLSRWKFALDNLDNTEKKWKAVLKFLRCSENECWGSGVFIFAPMCRTDMGKL